MGRSIDVFHRIILYGTDLEDGMQLQPIYDGGKVLLPKIELNMASDQAILAS